MTGEPRFGKGTYNDRERSWLRDLSERKVYDGPSTKQLYTQSLTLSGAWWELRLRFLRDFGMERGAKMAQELFLNHLKLMHDSEKRPRLADDYGFAQATIERLVTWPQSMRGRALCDLSNAFADHGFIENIGANCARENWQTDEDRVFASRAKALVSGKMSKGLLSAAPFPIEIPDERTLSFEFRVTAVPGAVTLALVLSLDIDHRYSDDLLIRVKAPDGTIHDVYKGEEELVVPRLITDRFAFDGARVEGIWTIYVVNFGRDMHGVVANLAFEVLSSAGSVYDRLKN
jgi:hypothetical protein